MSIIINVISNMNIIIISIINIDIHINMIISNIALDYYQSYYYYWY